MIKLSKVNTTFILVVCCLNINCEQSEKIDLRPYFNSFKSGIHEYVVFSGYNPKTFNYTKDIYLSKSHSELRNYSTRVEGNFITTKFQTLIVDKSGNSFTCRTGSSSSQPLFDFMLLPDSIQFIYEDIESRNQKTFSLDYDINLNRKFFNSSFEFIDIEKLTFREKTYDNCLKIKVYWDASSYSYFWLHPEKFVIQYQLHAEELYVMAFLEKDQLFQ